MSVVGIDLGTTNSCVAILSSSGKVQILPNDIGKNTTPSIVAFTKKGEIIVGQEAKNQMPLNPSNTVFGAKRLIGYKFGDDEINKEKETWPFQITEGNSGRAAVKVNYKGEEKVYSPEEISSFILLKLKDAASKGTVKPVKKAVITVPAYFNASQRQSTKDAGKIAGLDVIGIISEPTAAAIAYGIGTSSKEERIVFVFDFGGGTLDCTLMRVKNGSYEVIATSGNTHLGGEDIDIALSNYAANEFKRTTGIDILNKEKYKRNVAVLKLECEKLKCALSASGVSEQRLLIRNFADGKDLDIKITKAKFEYICNDILDGLQDPIDTLFESAAEKEGGDIDPTEFVTDVIMVGGSSHIPYVAKLLEETFEKRPIFGVDPDAAVATGAAIYAASLAKATKGFDVNEKLNGARRPGEEYGGFIQLIDPEKISDVVPLSLGIEVKTGALSVIIKNNSKVPCRQTERYYTTCDNQTSVAIKVYEGQRQIAKENRILGNFDVSGLTPRPAGQTSIDVTFDINKENILDVSVVEVGGTASGKVQLKNDIGHLTEEEIHKMEREAEEYLEADKRRLEANIAFNDLDDLISKASRKAGSSSSAKRLVDELVYWKDSNSSASASEIREKISEYQRKLSSYISI